MSTQFTETLNAVASEFGVEDTAKHGRDIKPSKRPYFRWTEEMTEKLVDLVDQQKTAEEIAVELCIPVERVRTKLTALKAKVPSAKPPKAEPATPKPEPSTEPVPEVSTEPVALDRIIFAAFSEFIGLVDNYDRTAGCWRKALRLIEKQLDGCTAMIAQYPETETHLCKIAAIVAYDELKA